MFNKYYITDNRSAVEAAHIKAHATKKFGDKLESISKNEIKSKDRVDITLEEYLTMRKRIETLESKYSNVSKLIVQLGIPAEVIDNIRLDTVNVVHNDDIRYFVRHYRIVFDAERLYE